MNFTILTSLIIVLLGIYFRIFPYNDIQGLWNDEYVGWYISQQKLIIPFIKGILSQCHMPLYYIYLKIYTFILGNSDLALRLSSFITGFLSIFVMFKVGNLKSRGFGFLCAFFTAVSGFLIYYSYEVRPYSMIFLFSALSLFYSLKLIQNNTSRNLKLYILSNVLILITHTLGFIYVITNMFIVGFILKNKNSKITSKIFLTIGAFWLIITPLILKIFLTTSFSQWWSNASISKLCYMFTDFFSNYLVNLVNAPVSFFSAIGWAFLFFGIIPTVICIYGLINAFSLKNEYVKEFFFMALIPTVILMLVSYTGKFIFLSKYNIEVYPILIYLSLLGLWTIKSKKLKLALLITMFVLNVSYLFTPNFHNYFIKPESNKLVAELLNNAQLNDDDIILFTYYPRERFSKYFDYSKYEIREIHKGNFFYYLTPNTSYQMAVFKGSEIYKPVYLSTSNKYFSTKIEDEFYENLKSGKKIAVVFLNSVELFSDMQIYSIASNEQTYKKVPQMYLIFSYVKNYLIKKLNTDLNLVKYEQNGDWSVAVFKKL